MEITIDIPEGLAKRLEQYRDRLPELLELGLREVRVRPEEETVDERRIIEILTSQPTPEEVLQIKPSVELQDRVSELLDRSKRGEISGQEENELDRYLMLEHIVRLAKAHAIKQI